MSVESGCLVFCLSLGKCLHSFFLCMAFSLVFALVFIFLPGVTRTWPHSIFGISISSHVALTYIQHNYTRHFHVSFIRFYRIITVRFFISRLRPCIRFIACTKLDTVLAHRQDLSSCDIQ